MPTYRFDLNDEYGKRLEKDAEDNMMMVQDYIRFPVRQHFHGVGIGKKNKSKRPV